VLKHSNTEIKAIQTFYAASVNIYFYTPARKFLDTSQ